MADFASQKSSYKNLRVFQKSEAIYDLTYLFLQKHIRKSDRTYDQMLQAARSGKQNIVEGRSDAGSSAEMEIKLYGVAFGSLHELLNDYLDFMRTRKIPIWEMNFHRQVKLKDFCAKNNSSAVYSGLYERLSDEEFCNLMLTLISQTNAMLLKLIELVKQDFLRTGGIKEQMYRARLEARNQNKR